MESKADLFIIVFLPHKNNPELRKRMSEYPDQKCLSENTILLAAEPGTDVFSELEPAFNDRDEIYIFSVKKFQGGHPRIAKIQLEDWISKCQFPDFGNARMGMTV